MVVHTEKVLREVVRKLGEVRPVTKKEVFARCFKVTKGAARLNKLAKTFDGLKKAGAIAMNGAGRYCMADQFNHRAMKD